MTVPLPDTGDGSRRQRRDDRKRRGRRSAARIAAIAVVVAVVGGIGWYIAGLVAGDDDDPPVSSAGDTTPVTDEPATLVVLVGDDEALYGVTMLVPATATIVHVPPGTLLEVPSLGLASLADAEREGGDELVRQSLENVLGARFAAVTRFGVDELLAAGPLTVTLDEAVEERNGAGRVVVVVPGGEQVLDASSVVTFLAATGSGTALDRIVRHQVFWSAFVAAGGVAAMDGVDVRQRVLPVESVAGVEADQELYRVVDDDLAAFVARVLPGATGAIGDRIRVRILNGVGAPGIAQQVQPLLLNAGAEVTLSGNADRFDYATTQVVYYDDARLDDARALAEALGVGEIVKSLAELGVVDVTVVVGADFLAAHPGG